MSKIPTTTATMPTPAFYGARYFKKWRKKAGLTIDVAAQIMGMSNANLSRMENGKTDFNSIWLERMSRLYGCTPIDLLTKDPLEDDKLSATFDRIRDAPPEIQERIIAVVDTLLRSR